MKNYIIIAFISVFTCSAFSQSTFDISLNEISLDIANKLTLKNKKKIVVLYVTDINKAQTVAGKYIADVISVNIVNDQGNFQVFDRENLTGIVEAKKMIAEGYIDADRAKELGKILAVDAIVIGNYTVLTTTLKLTLKALDVNSGFVIAASMKDVPITTDAGALLGITVGTGDNNANRGFNNRPLNSSESYNNPETVNKDCEANNTGDYCVLNSTNSGKVFRIYIEDKSKASFNMSVLGPLADKQFEDISLLPGETKCVYNWAARSYQSEIWGKNSRNETVVLRSANILIEKCKSKTFIIKEFTKSNNTENSNNDIRTVRPTDNNRNSGYSPNYNSGYSSPNYRSNRR